jgi:hypothetical protein
MAEQRAKGGKGGSAFVDGNGSLAEGGRGGDGVLGDGGNGGNAAVVGNHISVKGGKGGRGGICPGQPGTTIAIIQTAGIERDPASEAIVRSAAQNGQVIMVDWEPPYLHMEGGQGGEAPPTRRSWWPRRPKPKSFAWCSPSAYAPPLLCSSF